MNTVIHSTGNFAVSHVGSSLDSYLRMVKRFPMLTSEEEFNLAVSYQEKQDIESARQLVVSHLRFVVKIAKNYLGYGLAYADLIQEGTLGLMKAVQRFDPHKGVRLVTFAVHWIKAEIHEFIIRNWSIVKIATTKAQRKLFYNIGQLKKAKNCLTWFSSKEIKDVANELNVNPKEVIHMEKRLSAKDMSFDAPMDHQEEDDEHYFPSQYLTDPQLNPALLLENETNANFSQSSLKNALNLLDERSLYILRKRWLSSSKATLYELADYFKVSAERIRQLEKIAMEKLKLVLTETRA